MWFPVIVLINPSVAMLCKASLICMRSSSTILLGNQILCPWLIMMATVSMYNHLFLLPNCQSLCSPVLSTTFDNSSATTIMSHQQKSELHWVPTYVPNAPKVSNAPNATGPLRRWQPLAHSLPTHLVVTTLFSIGCGCALQRVITFCITVI
jgi:hypothetical protein